jgi:hypothetical protein
MTLARTARIPYAEHESLISVLQAPLEFGFGIGVVGLFPGGLAPPQLVNHPRASVSTPWGVTHEESLRSELANRIVEEITSEFSTSKPTAHVRVSPGGNQ